MIDNPEVADPFFRVSVCALGEPGLTRPLALVSSQPLNVGRFTTVVSAKSTSGMDTFSGHLNNVLASSYSNGYK